MGDAIERLLRRKAGHQPNRHAAAVIEAVAQQEAQAAGAA
jgi:hypothetical protein